MMNSEYHFREFDSVPSTNDTAKDLGKDGAPEWTVVTSKTQSAARGRRGRRWSAEEGGLYLSVLLYPSDTQHLQLLTFAAGVAIVNTLSEVANIDASLKWPNDVLVGGKKVCGILTEGVFGERPFVVVGVGLNVNQESLPSDSAYPATSLRLESGKEYGLDQLRYCFLGCFSGLYDSYEAGKRQGILSEWKECTTHFGKEVTILFGDQELKAIPLSVNEDGSLVAQVEGGQRRTFDDGEISLRLSQN